VSFYGTSSLERPIAVYSGPRWIRAVMALPLLSRLGRRLARPHMRTMSLNDIQAEINRLHSERANALLRE
jgi:hypothetical protein